MNEYERLRRQAIVLRDMYPPGSRVECLYMNDPFAPVPSGTKGTVFHVDDMAQIHVNWDNGSSLALNRDLILYSTNPDEGYLTERGIENLRSSFANSLLT